MPVPNVKLKQYSVNIQIFNPSTNSVEQNPAALFSYPVVINTDFTTEHFIKHCPIYIEMLIYRRKVGKQGNRTSGYIVTSKHIAGVGIDASLPWNQSTNHSPKGGFWTRSGAHAVGENNDMVNVDRINHIEVKSNIPQEFPVWQCLHNRLQYHDVNYREVGGGSQMLNTLIPVTGKRKSSKNTATKKFCYSPYYSAIYMAFRYIQWNPHANNDGGQIISGPLSKTIKISHADFPFKYSQQDSIIQGLPVCNINPEHDPLVLQTWFVHQLG